MPKIGIPKCLGKNTCSKNFQSTSHQAFLLKKANNNFQDKNNGVYVLELSDNRIYVGKSHNISKRIQEHLSGSGNKFVTHFIRQLPCATSPTDDWESWERAETLHWMSVRGIDKVRGWMFTSFVLTPEDKKNAFYQLCERYDLCRKCGKRGHFVSFCGC